MTSDMLIDALGDDAVVLDKVLCQRTVGYSHKAAFTPVVYVSSIASKLGCSLNDALDRAQACHVALLAAFDMPLWREEKGAPSPVQSGELHVSHELGYFAGPRANSVSGGTCMRQHISREGNCLRQVSARLNERLETIVESARRGETRHFFYRLPCPTDSLAAWKDIEDLCGSICKLQRTGESVWRMPERLSMDRPFRNPGFQALASGLLRDPHAVRVMPDLNLFQGGGPEIAMWINDGKAHRLPRTAWERERVDAMLHYRGLIRKFQGVHVWCCPAATKVDWYDVPESGISFLPGLETSEGRLAVYNPIFQAQQHLLANSSCWTEGQKDENAGDLERMCGLVVEKLP